MGMIRTPDMKVICPTAPTIPVTLNAGFRMPSWFDLKTLDIGGPEDEDGIRKATKNVHEMIRTEMQVRYIGICNSCKFYSNSSISVWNFVQSHHVGRILAGWCPCAVRCINLYGALSWSNGSILLVANAQEFPRTSEMSEYSAREYILFCSKTKND